MAAAPVPSYYLNWGLISLAVKSYIAARDERSPLVNMHAKCAAEGKEAKLNTLSKCSCCGEFVDKTTTVKSMKLSRGKEPYRHVTFTLEEIEKLSVESSKALDVLGFVPQGSIDSVYLGKSDYLGPNDPAGMKPFVLLREAMKSRKVDAVVKFAGSGKDKIGLIRWTAFAPDCLVMHELFYANEVRTYEAQTKVPISGSVSDMELQLAKQLIEAGQIDSELFKQESDSFQTRLRDLIKSRIEGAPAPEIAAPTEAKPTVDLMAALRASLEAKKVA